MSSNPPSVTLYYLTLIHYRESVFQRLAADPAIDFSICCGKRSPYVGMKNFEPVSPLRVSFVRNLVIRLGKKHYVAWQFGSIFHYLRNRPDVVILLGFDPHILSTIPLFFLARLFGSKVLWWSHATLGQQGKLSDAIRLYFYRHADGVLTYDDVGRKRLLDAGLRPDTTHTIWNCINDSEYADIAGQTPPPKSGPPHILYVGRIYHEKKLETLIRAANVMNTRDFEFAIDIVGDGPDKLQLEKLSETLDLNRQITFHGAVYKDGLHSFLATATIGVVPSWAGLSVVQFMAAGLPTVTEESTGRNHPPEVSFIIEGETGAFYRFEDPEDLADVIINTIEIQETLSASCIRLAHERFSPTAVKSEIVNGVRNVTD